MNVLSCTIEKLPADCPYKYQAYNPTLGSIVKSYSDDPYTITQDFYEVLREEAEKREALGRSLPEETTIHAFNGPYRWLSNFYPVHVHLEGIQYPSVEHAYQASKEPSDQRDRYTTCTAGAAKAMGKKAVLPEDWEEKKVPLMWTLLIEKFNNLPLMQKLIDTGDMQIVEGNYWNDTFWGRCCGKGKNILGKLLMDVRTICKYDCESKLSLDEYTALCKTIIQQSLQHKTRLTADINAAGTLIL